MGILLHSQFYFRCNYVFFFSREFFFGFFRSFPFTWANIHRWGCIRLKVSGLTLNTVHWPSFFPPITSVQQISTLDHRIFPSPAMSSPCLSSPFLKPFSLFSVSLISHSTFIFTLLSISDQWSLRLCDRSDFARVQYCEFSLYSFCSFC